MISVLNKSYNISIYSSILLFLVGLFLFISPDLVISLISYILGFFLFINGITQIVRYYRNIKISFMTIYLFVGIVFIVAGLILIIKPNLIATIIPFTIGIFVIINSIEEITVSLSLKEYNKNWFISFIFGIATLFFGIFLILNPLIGSYIVTEILGLILMIYSIIDIVERSLIKKKINSNFDNKIIDMK